MQHKQPLSVLVVIYARANDKVLMLQRQDDVTFWQSVTGSLEGKELPWQTALREVKEEVGIDIAAEKLLLHDCQRQVKFEIFPHLRARYAPGVTHNREHWFCLPLPAERPIKLLEHRAYQWLCAAEAIALTKSWSNRQAIQEYVLNKKISFPQAGI